MKVYRYGEDQIDREPHASLTLGAFDGVHLGHHALLDRVLEGDHPTVVTFDPHPQHVLGIHADRLRILTPVHEKLAKLELAGIERTVIIPFSRALASWSANQFLKGLLLDTIGMNRLVVGFNHSFGRDREGNIDFMRAKAPEYGYELEVVDARLVEQIAVSSTRIRNALTEGDLFEANKSLGRAYRLEATVVRGEGRGRDLGFPTANLEPHDPDQLVPAEGVYVVRVHYEGRLYDGVGSIGRKETFGKNPLTLEVHLFNFAKDLYDQVVQVEWVEFLRGQEAYASAKDLIEQMHKDAARAKQILGV
ncbi:bifunctional riboflavin kinase/FAD synthetase [bacterium]|nr:bifunctional riboflavin kinase/FAD synthetase [bacterium]